MNDRITNVLFNLLIGVIGGLLLIILIDLIYSPHLLTTELYILLFILACMLIASTIATTYKNKFLLLTLRKLILTENETGISSYVNAYLREIEKNGVFSIRKAYKTFEKHLTQNYYFRVPPGDYVRVLESIFKSGDNYCVSLVSIFSDLKNRLQIETTRNNIKIIISKNIYSDSRNENLIDNIRKEAFTGRILWRKGDPPHVFNVIISLKKFDGDLRPIRALKFEVGEERVGEKREKEMYIITDTESLRFWYRYFIEDFSDISKKIKEPICTPEGAAQVEDAIIEICDNYPDLHKWMEETIEEEKSNETIRRALDQLKKPGGYKSECVDKLFEICKESE